MAFTRFCQTYERVHVPTNIDQKLSVRINMELPSAVITIITNYLDPLYWYRHKGRLVRWDLQALLETVI